MPTRHRLICTPVFHRGRSVWAAGCLVALGMLAGCAAPSAPAPEAIVGSAAETELHRLAHTRLQLGVMYFQEERYAIALGEVAQALQAYPGYVDAYNLQGWIYLSQKEFAQAEASFAKALALRPQDADTRYNLGWALCQQKKYAAAEPHFEAALQDVRTSDASKARTWLAKGVCLREAGRQPEAAYALAQAFELEPANPTATYHYAQVLMEQGQYERAQFYARRLNNSEHATAASLWLGVKIERVRGDSVAMRQLADQLHRRFPDSREWHRFERGAFDE